MMKQMIPPRQKYRGKSNEVFVYSVTGLKDKCLEEREKQSEKLELKK